MTAKVNPDTTNEDAFPDELRPGTELLHGQYVIEKYLNSGGFGITYLAKDSLDRTVVIKECFPGSFCRRTDTIVTVRSRAHQNEFQSIVKLFVQEAKNLAKLKHPNIVGVHQIFEDNDTAYMALDYVDGRDLLDILEDPNDGLTPAEIQSITQKLLSAVEYIHKGGVLHRDISPDNILIDRKTGDPVLIDFGAAREEATRQTRLLSAMRVVKDGYSPQEFYIQGSQQSPSSDLYALAATLFHVMTGECPPDSQARLAAVAAQKPDPYRAFPPEVPGYDPKFLKAINQAMNIFPYDRIQSAAEWMKFIAPEPEIVALPSAKITPRRPTSVIADETDLADHAEASTAVAVVEPPVPVMVPAPQLETPQDAEKAKLDSFRNTEPEKSPRQFGLGVLLGGVAAAAVVSAVSVYFVLPEGSLFGQEQPDPQLAQQPAPATQTPSPAASPDPTPEVAVAQAPAQDPEPTPAAPSQPAEIAASEPSQLIEPETESTLAVPEVAEAAPTEALVGSDVATTEAEVSEPGFPAPTTSDVQPAEPVAEATAESPVLSLAEASNLVPAGEQEPLPLSEQVAQSVMAAIAPPAAPLTEAPDNIVEIALRETTPDVFATVETIETTDQRTIGALQRNATVDQPPVVDIATAEPQPEPLDPLLQEIAGVTAGWTVDIPFTQNRLDPTLIGEPLAGAPDWAQPGVKIISVNGTQVAAINDIPELVRNSATLTANGPVTVQVQYQAEGDPTVRDAAIELSVAHGVSLQNGFEFATLQVDGEWRTMVTASPETGANALRPGDRLVAYIPTNERLNREKALSEIFIREIENGTSQFAFAVNRDGELWVASVGYDGGTGN